MSYLFCKQQHAARFTFCHPVHKVKTLYISLPFGIVHLVFLAHVVFCEESPSVCLRHHELAGIDLFCFRLLFHPISFVTNLKSHCVMFYFITKFHLQFHCNVIYFIIKAANHCPFLFAVQASPTRLDSNSIKPFFRPHPPTPSTTLKCRHGICQMFCTSKFPNL